jgi:hypothetical protein
MLSAARPYLSLAVKLAESEVASHQKGVTQLRYPETPVNIVPHVSPYFQVSTNLHECPEPTRTLLHPRAPYISSHSTQ